MRRIFFVLICLLFLSACTSEKERFRPDSDVAIVDQDTDTADTNNDTEIPPEDTSHNEDIDEATDPCAPNPCANNGTCTAIGDTFTCTCPAEFTGETCETSTNPCDPNPCANNGTCTANADTFTCECTSEFTGETCETSTNPCDPNPCANNGTCTANADTFTCECPSEFTGDLCQHDNPCDPNPCANNGFCQSFDSSTAHCICPGNWQGSTCEECGTACSDRPDYYRDRFLSCFHNKDFCEGRSSSCEVFCSGWMGCEGPLEINSDGITTAIGPDAQCY